MPILSVSSATARHTIWPSCTGHGVDATPVVMFTPLPRNVRTCEASENHIVVTPAFILTAPKRAITSTKASRIVFSCLATEYRQWLSVASRDIVCLHSSMATWTVHYSSPTSSESPTELPAGPRRESGVFGKSFNEGVRVNNRPHAQSWQPNRWTPKFCL